MKDLFLSLVEENKLKSWNWSKTFRDLCS